MTTAPFEGRAFTEVTPEEYRKAAADFVSGVDFEIEHTDYRYGRNVHDVRMLSDKGRALIEMFRLAPLVTRPVFLYLVDRVPCFGGGVDLTTTPDVVRVTVYTD